MDEQTINQLVQRNIQLRLELYRAGEDIKEAIALTEYWKKSALQWHQIAIAAIAKAEILEATNNHGKA